MHGGMSQLCDISQIIMPGIMHLFEVAFGTGMVIDFVVTLFPGIIFAFWLNILADGFGEKIRCILDVFLDVVFVCGFWVFCFGFGFGFVLGFVWLRFPVNRIRHFGKSGVFLYQQFAFLFGNGFE